jgi:hypothetical protein
VLPHDEEPAVSEPPAAEEVEEASAVTAAAPPPVPAVVPASNESRLGAIGGFKMVGAGAGDSDLAAKLQKKREAADQAASTTTTTTTTSVTTSSSSSAAPPTSQRVSSSSVSDASAPGGYSGVNRRSSGPTSPTMGLKSTVIAPPPAAVVVAVPACTTCGCNEFKQDPFKKAKCSNCFHQHWERLLTEAGQQWATAAHQLMAETLLLCCQVQMYNYAKCKQRVWS